MTGNDMSHVEPSGGGGNGRVMLVRTLSGLVRESRRVVHIVPVGEATELSQELSAYCGEVLDLSPGYTSPHVLFTAEAPGGEPQSRCQVEATR